MDSCVNNNLKILKMREPKQLIEECKKHLRDTEQYKHEYKKDIRKLITALEKQLSIHVVSQQSELLFCKCGSVKNGGYGCMRTDCDNTLQAFMQNNCG
jgi:hypothetical protein